MFFICFRLFLTSLYRLFVSNISERYFSVSIIYFLSAFSERSKQQRGKMKSTKAAVCSVSSIGKQIRAKDFAGP